MNRFLRAVAVSVLCTIGAIGVSQAQTVTCQNAQYDSGSAGQVSEHSQGVFGASSRRMAQTMPSSRQDSIASTTAEEFRPRQAA